MRFKFQLFSIIALLVLASCQTSNQSQNGTAARQESGDQTTSEEVAQADQEIDYDELDPDGDGMTDEGLPLPIRPEDRVKGVPTVTIPLVHKETGEVREVEAKLVEVDKKEYFLPNEDPSLHLDLTGKKLVNADGEKVELSNDRVTIIEYWSVDSIERNMYWSNMRYLERQHPPEELQILSINYDMVQRGDAQIKQALKKLEKFTAPKNLLFDLNDGMRDVLPRIPGPASYFLIDLRKQITASGRGDRSDVEHLLKRLDDALIHQESQKNQGRVTVVQKNDESSDL